jgi:hypothetical protein
MDYLYFLANASLTLRVVEYLHSMPQLPVQFITVIHQIDGWVVKVKMNRPLTPHQHGDFRAFMNELGIPYDPEIRLQMALWSLETGQSPYRSDASLPSCCGFSWDSRQSDIEAFRQQFTMGLGYCPETLA